MTQVTVARTLEGQLPFFPNAIRLLDGRILVVYREGRHHVSSVGRIAMVESPDDGATWSEPRIVVDTLLDDRDPMLVQLSTGDILLSYFRIDWHKLPWEVPGVDVIRSTDGGHTWGEPVEVGSTMRQETDERWHRFRAGHIASHGQILELPNGDLLAPVYGVFPGDTHHSASVVRSTDKGGTWRAEDEVVIGRKPGRMYVEPVLTLLPGGQVTALLRTDQDAELTRSDDNGHTWSTPEPLELHASSADTITLADGSVLLAYGDVSKRLNPGRPTLATIITDPLGPWDKGVQHLVHDAGAETFDQANPAVVELSDGRLLIISYDIFQREIVAVFRDRAALT
ncbi:sialidase family protein [Kribbella deserti]|uniref:Sialidase family protein n=1 Tax=Kribbella deserti TaxID=1926257 RepID=A0ABV6QRV0_9ACTN